MNEGTAAYYTLGCKLNFSETSTIGRDLSDNGYAKVDFEKGADVYVINTCSVTDQADKKCRNIVRKALKFNPNAFVIVIGCYAQLKPKEIANIDGVDLVLGAQEKFNIINHLDNRDKKQNAIVKNNPIKNVRTFYPGYSKGDRTRSFFKVQDGCNYFCSFCTIPLARGKSRSANVEETIVKAKEIHKKNIRLAREKKLAELDVDFQRALETSADTSVIVSKKQALRDAPASAGIGTAVSDTDLKANWDTSILGDSPYS